MERGAAYWRAASPQILRRARGFADRAHGLHMRAQVLGEDLSHRQIDEWLGLPGDCTAQGEAFLAMLDPAVARRLNRR